MDDRSLLILKQLVENGTSTEPTIMKQFNITKRQLHYSIQKINETLLDRKLAPIQVSDNETVMIHQSNPDLRSFIASFEKPYVYSKSEREMLLFLMLVDREDPLSLQHFVSALFVSKNTVLKDLHHLKKHLKTKNILISYTRDKGYEIKGDEFMLRKIFAETLYQFVDSSVKKTLLLNVLNLDQNDLLPYANIIQNIEKQNGQHFIDVRLNEMNLVLKCYLKRYQRGKVLTTDVEIQGLHYTKEYATIGNILKQHYTLPDKEVLMIALFLVSSHISTIQSEVEKENTELDVAVDTIINNFETISCIIFEDRDTLFRNILQHLKPAYYRMKYGLNLSADVGHIDSLETLNNEFWIVREIVKKSSTHFANLVNREIPDNEINLLTVIFGSWIRKQGSRIMGHPKVLLVTLNGISTHHLLHTMLRELFPEFIFTDSISLRAFEDYQEDYDIIFSSAYLETDKYVFIVSVDMMVTDRSALRNRVLNEIYGVGYRDIDVNDLMEIVKHHASIQHENQLRTALEHYVTEEPMIRSFAANLNLSDLLKNDCIQIVGHQSNWEAIIRLAAQPLLKKQKITEAYVDKVISINEAQTPYVILGSQIAIPHAAPADGVQGLGASMVVLKKPVVFGTALIRVFILLAPIDKTRHLNAVLQAADLSMESEPLTKILASSTSEEIRNIIIDFERSNNAHNHV